MDGAVDIFRVSDALFCVSVRTNRLHEWFQIRHRDRPTKSENYLEGLNHSKENKGKHVRRFLAESGFIFNVFANNVAVIEPTTGLFVLTMRFARLVWLGTLVIPSVPGLHDNGPCWYRGVLHQSLQHAARQVPALLVTICHMVLTWVMQKEIKFTEI
ncbi:hypothetical protein Pelo_16764 [Pelomyxa schiedti]|nr:hypothetical protein Pelo_16764 [Pelomyxa schiedti]